MRGFALPGFALLVAACSTPTSEASGNGLRTVETVTYRPGTVVVQSEIAASVILERSDDDSDMLLDSASPEIAALASGDVLLLGGVALRKVSSATRESGGLRVKSEPAALTDAIEDGQLHWKGKVDWSGIRHMQTGLPGAGLLPRGMEPWSNKGGVSGQIRNWKFAFTGEMDKDDLVIKARIDGVADALNAWVEIEAKLAPPEIQGDITIHEHLTENAAFATRAARAKVTAKWSTGINAESAKSVKDILFLPVDLPIPILGTIPLFFRVGANFAFIAALVGRGTGASGQFEWSTDASSSIGGAGDAPPSAEGTTTSTGSIGGSSFQAAAGSALGVVVNVPRFGVSLGTPNVAELVYSVGGVISLEARASGFVGAGAGVPCQAFELTVKATHGIEGKLLGLTLWKASQDLGEPFKKTSAQPTNSSCKL